MTKRIFLSIPLPCEFIKSLVTWQGLYVGLKGARWTVGENLHITLAFLGDVEEESIAELVRLLSDELKEVKGFELKFKEVVLAPPGGRPRMIWADFCISQEFNDLVGGVWKVAGRFVKKEVYDRIKPPAMHITLARFRQPIYLSGLKQPELGGKVFKAERVELMESELTSERPYYRVIKEFKL